MKEIEGIELVAGRVKTEDEFVLIFWLQDEPSQQLSCNNEDECDAIMDDIVEGKGVLIAYDFQQNIVRVFPRRVLKLKCEREAELSRQDYKKLRDAGTFTDDFKKPAYFNTWSNNIYTPSLVRNENKEKSLDITEKSD